MTTRQIQVALQCWFVVGWVGWSDGCGAVDLVATRGKQNLLTYPGRNKDKKSNPVDPSSVSGTLSPVDGAKLLPDYPEGSFEAYVCPFSEAPLVGTTQWAIANGDKSSDCR
ncbi:hypothetical protein QBC45DRAFT_485997 [Copromyces sp. CBS 386.78]|nr:hypothetical protein QBC45DRAFT_485997 [Copromyces sp. CBS 386.78]